MATLSAVDYLNLVVEAVTAKISAGWTVHETIPGPGDSIQLSQEVFVDLLEEGDGTLSDGTGYGVVLGLLLVKQRTVDDPVGDRKAVAIGVYELREILRTTPGLKPDRVVVSYRTWGTIGDIPVVSAEVEIERKIHTSS